MGVITITNGRHISVGMEQGLQRDGKDGCHGTKGSALQVPPPVTPLPPPDSPAPAKSGARRILRAWWASFTFNGITAYGDGERDALLELCRQRLDAFREQRGEEVACLFVGKPAASSTAPATAPRSAAR
jgi:hypothetical protein